MMRKDLTWKDVKKEVYTNYKPIEELCRRLRVKIEFKEGFFCTEQLMKQIQKFLDKITVEPEDLLLVDVETTKAVRQQLRLFTDSANDLELEERTVLFYLLVAKESEADIAKNRLANQPSMSSVNRMKRSVFMKLLENVQYNRIMV